MAKAKATNFEIENAKIRSTMLGIEDHGIMTFWLDLEGDGWGQGFGGYGIDGHDPKNPKIRPGNKWAITAIRQVLETVDVLKWEDLKGTLVRVKRYNGWNGPIEIGHITKNKWFSLSEFFASHKEK